MSSAPSAENCLMIAGQVVGRVQNHVSPAGIPIHRFLLEHHSAQVEAGISREVRCRIPVMVCGEALTAVTKGVQEGQQVRVRGFIGRANYREGEYRFVLHADHIETLDEQSAITHDLRMN